MSIKLENRAAFGPIQSADSGLHIDYTRRARREQAIAVRVAFEWFHATLERGVRAFGERLERAITGGAERDARTF